MFETSTYGKWILTGEHAVLRGQPAVVFPLKSRTLTLKLVEGDPAALVGPFKDLLDYGLRLLDRDLADIPGTFILENTIPLGQGMGGSAALSVALSRAFVHLNFLAEENVLTFAKELEHFFHGKSSGLDVAAVGSEAPIYFLAGKISPFTVNFKPHFALSSSGQIGKTLDCIKKVQASRDEDLEKAEALDAQMGAATKKATEAFQTASLALLAEAINTAAQSFEDWGLISEALRLEMQRLKAAGAIAVKPTGSGAGGFVLSLWKNPPPAELVDILI